ncbi:hypothetical protein KQH27_00710 [bacterium]|nr:hypothetical protein [bacterium]
MNELMTQPFGVSPTTFFFILGFWTLLFMIFIRNEREVVLATLFCSSLTALIIGKIGVVLFILLVATIIGVGIFFLFRGGTQTTTPIYQNTATPSYTPFSGPSSYSTGTSYQSSFKLPPAVLYHGTRTLKAASDILSHNRWLTKPHYPQGVYLSDDFNTAASYAGLNGIVVEVQSYITADMIVEHNQSTLTSDQLLSQGYRLIRNGKVYIAPTPANTNGNYIRIEGLLPVRLLNKKGNPISATFN